ncbi:MAG: hypothetical protein ACFFCW_21890 [Candidatus Hodarchaeota archaeon]
MQNNAQEGIISVLLSEILEKAGINNISLLNLRRVPDIYILLSGLRIVITINEEENNEKLQKKLEKRLDKNICDLCVGLEYPSRIVTEKCTDKTTTKLCKRIITEDLRIKGLIHGGSGFRIVIRDSNIRITELPELLASVTEEVMSDTELESAINQIRNTIKDFAKGVSTLPNADYLAKSIRKELEFGKE